MPTLAEVKQQIADYGQAYIFWTNKEIRYLPKILDDNERIKAVTSGILNSRTWLAVCTDRRLLFINCNMFIGMEEIQMPLDRVQSLDHLFTLFFGTIRVYDGVDVFAMNMVLKSSILPFIKATQAAMYARRMNVNTAPAGAQPGPAPVQHLDVASQLAKLADLMEKGHLTEAEFQEQKKKLLAR